jgi:hypothetical protein
LIDSGGLFVDEPVIDIVEKLYSKLKYKIYYVNLLGEKLIFDGKESISYMNQQIDDTKGFIYYG